MNWSRLKLLTFQNKLFNKMLLYFLSFLIPIVVIGSIAYYHVDSLVKRDVVHKLTDNLSFSARTIDNYVEMSQKANNNLLLSNTINRYLMPYRQMSDEDKLNIPHIIKALAENMNLLNSFVDRIFMYTDTDRIYTSQEIAEFNTFFDDFYQMERYPKSFWNQKLLKSGFFELLPPSQVAYYNGNLYKKSIPSVFTQYVNGRLVTIVTCISTEAIKTSIQNNSIFNVTSYFIVDKNNNIMVRDDAITEKAISEITSQFPKLKTSEYIEMNNERVLVIKNTSELFGWEYYSITPVTAFNHEATSILGMVLWICIAMIGIGIVLAFVFSVKLYNPIRNIHNILIQSEKPSGSGSDHRSSDELRMIGNRIHQLVQQHEDATLKISKYSSELLDQFFKNLLQGHPWTQQETLNEILEGISFKADRYLCCTLMFSYKERYFHEIEEAERLLIQEKMKKVVWGIIKRYLTCYLLEYESNFYVCIVSIKSDEDRQQLDRALKNLRETFEYDMIYCEFSIGLGKMYHKVEDIAVSYSDAITAMDRRANTFDDQIVDAADYKIEQTYYFSFLDENKIVNALKTGNMEAVKADVEQLIELNKSRGVSYSFLSALVVELWNTGIRYVQEKQLGSQQLLAEEEYKVLVNKNRTPSEFNDYVKRLLHFYERIIADTAAKSESRSDTVIGLVTAYIEKNYHRDIYLESISDEIGLSAKHVSRTFKEGTGTSITDYIGLVRISKAKEMLLHTDYRINEIAERVGISSRTTFLRVFKKIEGISPADFRNSLLLKRELDDVEL